MTEYVDVEIEPGVMLTVSVPESSENELVDAGKAKDLARATQESFSSTVDSIRVAASTALTRFRAMPERPSEVSIEFSIQLAAAAGVVIASTSATANMKVTVKWTDLTGVSGKDGALR